MYNWYSSYFSMRAKGKVLLLMKRKLYIAEPRVSILTAIITRGDLILLRWYQAPRASRDITSPLRHAGLVKRTPTGAALHRRDAQMTILTTVLGVKSAASTVEEWMFLITNTLKCIRKQSEINKRTWLSRKGWGYLCWSAILTRYVMASTPHSLIRMCGCWQTSNKWFVSGLHRTSTLGKFTKPVSKSLATANSDGS